MPSGRFPAWVFLPAALAALGTLLLDAGVRAGRSNDLPTLLRTSCHADAFGNITLERVKRFRQNGYRNMVKK